MINIGIYGNVNAGKSSLLNYIIGQQVAIVSPLAGTTTDVVKASFEIPNFAPVTFFDTAGFCDNSELGRLRIEKTLQTLDFIDLAIIIEDQLPLQIDPAIFSDIPKISFTKNSIPAIEVIFENIRSAIPLCSLVEPSFYGNLLQKGETVVLVCPIDNGAPSGRLILPQMQAIRAALDLNAYAIAIQPQQFRETLERVKVDLVVTDSQAFRSITEIVNQHNITNLANVQLTSFSILLADLKGDINTYKRGLDTLPILKKSAKILIIEYCSHHPSCDDIGHVKIPALLNEYVGQDLDYTFVTGKDRLPENVSDYVLAIQCGGCMVNRKMIINRIAKLSQAGIPITNYGLLLRKLLTLKKS